MMVFLRVAVLLLFTVGGADASLTVDDPNYFARHADYENAKISPDGQHLAVSYLRDGRTVMAILKLETRKPMAGIEAPDEGHISDFHWVNDGRLVYSIATRAGSLDQPAATGELYGVNIDGSNNVAIFGFRTSGRTRTARNSRQSRGYSLGSHQILNFLPQDEHAILIAEYAWKGTGTGYAFDPSARPTIYRLNVNDGAKSKVGRLPIGGGLALVDNAGEVRFALGVDSHNNPIVKYKPLGEQDWKEFSMPGFDTESISQMAFGANPDEVYLTVVKDGDSTSSLVKLNLTTRATDVLFNHPRVDITGLMLDPVTREVIAARTEAGRPDYSYLVGGEQQAAGIHQSLRAAFQGQDVTITSATENGDKMVIYVDSDSNPGDFFLLETATAKAKPLLRRRPWVSPKQMSRKQPFSFKARDGRTIDGYLSLPSNGKGPFPAVINPHGGPHGIRDHWSFDADAQFLTSRGYAVVQVNFRGSGGYGMDHLESGYGQWGAAMQDDVTDATRWAVEAGHVDADRMCIYGASYGGYAALMGVVREPDLYRCAIGYVGVYDLEMMFERGDIPQTRRGRSYLQEVIGDDKNQLTARSPVAHVDKIKAALFLVHGGEDQRVPIAQAHQLRRALDRISKPYEWLVFDKEGHGFWKVEHRAELYRQLGAFLDKHTQPEKLAKQ